MTNFFCGVVSGHWRAFCGLPALLKVDFEQCALFTSRHLQWKWEVAHSVCSAHSVQPHCENHNDRMTEKVTTRSISIRTILIFLTCKQIFLSLYFLYKMVQFCSLIYSSIFHCYSIIPETVCFIKRGGLFFSLIWKLKARILWPIMFGLWGFFPPTLAILWREKQKGKVPHANRTKLWEVVFQEWKCIP